jgi:hypothetical protein
VLHILRFEMRMNTMIRVVWSIVIAVVGSWFEFEW